MDIIFSDN